MGIIRITHSYKYSERAKLYKMFVYIILKSCPFKKTMIYFVIIAFEEITTVHKTIELVNDKTYKYLK